MEKNVHISFLFAMVPRRVGNKFYLVAHPCPEKGPSGPPATPQGTGNETPAPLARKPKPTTPWRGPARRRAFRLWLPVGGGLFFFASWERQ